MPAQVSTILHFLSQALQTIASQQHPTLNFAGIYVIPNFGWITQSSRPDQVQPLGLIGHAHIVAAHTIFLISALVPLFVQSIKILSLVLDSKVLDPTCPNEILDQDLSPVETSTMASVTMIPAATSIIALPNSPSLHMQQAAIYVHPAKPSGPGSRTQL